VAINASKLQNLCLYKSLYVEAINAELRFFAFPQRLVALQAKTLSLVEEEVLCIIVSSSFEIRGL